jgi:hypothetical protein
MKLDATMAAAGGGALPEPGSRAWLNMWVGHARPGARQMVGPFAETWHASAGNGDGTGEGLGRRVQALVGAGLLVAVWKKSRDGGEFVWHWHLTRTRAPLPAVWPALTGTRVVGAKLITKRAPDSDMTSGRGNGRAVRA